MPRCKAKCLRNQEDSMREKDVKKKKVGEPSEFSDLGF